MLCCCKIEFLLGILAVGFVMGNCIIAIDVSVLNMSDELILHFYHALLCRLSCRFVSSFGLGRAKVELCFLCWASLLEDFFVFSGIIFVFLVAAFLLTYDKI